MTANELLKELAHGGKDERLIAAVRKWLATGAHGAWGHSRRFWVCGCSCGENWNSSDAPSCDGCGMTRPDV